MLKYFPEIVFAAGAVFGFLLCALWANWRYRRITRGLDKSSVEALKRFSHERGNYVNELRDAVKLLSDVHKQLALGLAKVEAIRNEIETSDIDVDIKTPTGELPRRVLKTPT